MSVGRQSVRLGEVLKRSTETAVIQPEVEYQEITVRLWGKGVVPRGTISGAQLAGQRRFVARAGHFVLSRIDARHGASGLVPPSLDGALVSNDFPVFTVDTDRLHPAYLGWMSRTENFITICRAASEGTTNRVRLSETSFLALRLELPFLGEQQRVLRQLGAVAAELELRTNAAKAGEAELDALLRSAFTRITAGAPQRRLGDVAPLVRRPIAIEPDGFYPELGVRSFGRGLFDKPVLRGAELTWQSLFRIEDGDLVFSNIKAWEGAFAVAAARHHGMVGSHRYLTCVVDSTRAIPGFLWFALQSPDGLEQISNASPGSADRNRTLSQSALNAIEVPLPDLDAQGWFDALQAEAAKARAARTEADTEAMQLLPALLAETFSNGALLAGEPPSRVNGT